MSNYPKEFLELLESGAFVLCCALLCCFVGEGIRPDD